ncbi:hypothetical protein EDB19DRAFT_1825987 [Suillus lakei]|nr:hypothetical protein EDB19DRAFT_1825987 [Suillus lakei]
MVTSASAVQGASVAPHGAGGDAGGGCSGGAGGAWDTGGTKATFTANSTGSTCGGKTRVEKYVGIDMQGHVASITHRPVGMGAKRVARDTFHVGIQPKPEALSVLYADWKIIVGRDKSKIIKGVLQTVISFLLVPNVIINQSQPTGSLPLSLNYLHHRLLDRLSPAAFAWAEFLSNLTGMVIALIAVQSPISNAYDDLLRNRPHVWQAVHSKFDRLVWLGEKKPPRVNLVLSTAAIVSAETYSHWLARIFSTCTQQYRRSSRVTHNGHPVQCQ